MDKRDVEILMHIKRYSVDVSDAILRFGNSFKTFSEDVHFKNTISMSLLQIGELSTGLSEDFKDSTRAQIPWGLIRGMRNRFTHGYDSMEESYIWETATKDIPVLKEFCDRIISQEKEPQRFSIDDIEASARAKADDKNKNLRNEKEVNNEEKDISH